MRGALRQALFGGGPVVTPPSVWTPASLSSNLLRFAADGLALSDTDPITSWTEPHGFAATQATGTKKPLYRTNQFGSLPGVVPDGNDDCLVNAAFTGLNGATAWALSAAAKCTNTADNQILFWAAGTADRKCGLQITSATINVYAGTDGNTYGSCPSNPVNDNMAHIYLAEYDGSQTGSANRLKLWVDGVQQTLSFPGTAIPASLGNSTGFEVGGSSDAARAWNGPILEIDLFGAALSQSDKNLVGNYLERSGAVWADL